MMGLRQVARLVSSSIFALVLGASAAYAQTPGCAFSFGATNGSPVQPTPTYTPNNPASVPFGLSITEVQGGSSCPWTAATSNIAIVAFLSDTPTGSNTGIGTSIPLPFFVPSAPTLTAHAATITVSPSGSGQGTSAVLNVTQEGYLQTTASAGQFTEPLTVSQSGTLVIPNIASGSSIPTVCSASDFNGLDVHGNNFFISCSAQLSNGPPQLSITISSSTPASRLRASTTMFVCAVVICFPAILLVRTATLGQITRPTLRLNRRIICTLNLGLLASSLLLLPSCGGGFKAVLTSPPPVSYVLTVMGYVTDANGKVTGVEVFTDFLNVEK
jgi:hypothetical protein